MLAERAKLSRHDNTAKAFNYMLNRWASFTRFLDDGRICLTNNAAERALRGIALGRRAWLFAGSDRGGERAAIMYSLIVSAKMNAIDPQGLARRCPRPDRGYAANSPGRVAALELDHGKTTIRGLAVAAISYAYTIRLVAEMLGESEDDIFEVTIDMEPEDGVFGVIDKLEGDDTSSLTVFTENRIDNLRELILDMKRNGQWPAEKLSP